MKSDKQVYFERNWHRCVLMSQRGTTVSVRLDDGLELTVPFQHVRDFNATCKDCGRLLWSSSYQAHSGDSYCTKCYDKMDKESIDLMFGGYQWQSWDGQLSVSEMDDDHLINTLGRLRRNAEQAAELTGGTPDQHLSPHFPHLVDELRRRRPEDIGSVKMNSMLLAFWTVIMTILLRAGFKPTVEAPKPKRTPIPNPKPVRGRKKKPRKRNSREDTITPDYGPQVPW